MIIFCMMVGSLNVLVLLLFTIYIYIYTLQCVHMFTSHKLGRRQHVHVEYIDGCTWLQQGQLPTSNTCLAEKDSVVPYWGDIIMVDIMYWGCRVPEIGDSMGWCPRKLMSNSKSMVVGVQEWRIAHDSTISVTRGTLGFPTLEQIQVDSGNNLCIFLAHLNWS